MQNLKEPIALINNKVIHFIGIGGIGMSGLANLLFSLGFNVQGSDLESNKSIERLQQTGINIFIGHHPDNLQNADIIITSSAIKDSNIEYQHALTKKLPIYKRGRVLGEIMGFYYGITITGAHGKTTTTSLVGEILNQAGLEPTVVVGGVVNGWKSNLKLGQGKFFVAEADESDGSFLNLPSMISVVTNIESEHLDYYGTYDNLKNHFINFINKVPFFGKAILCIDNSEIKDILPLINNANISTYGTSKDADYRAFDISYTSKGTKFSVFIKNKNQTIADIQSEFHGIHNVLNALAAIAVADSLELNCIYIIKTLKQFKGINRRFTHVGTYNGVPIFDDYAHHPSEISAVLVGAKNLVKDQGRIITILQPHRYSRLKDYFNNFVEALKLSDIVISLPVYSAGEQPNGYTHTKLVEALQQQGHSNAISLDGQEQLITHLLKTLKKHDIIINMGAGSITNIAKNLANLLKSSSLNK